MHGAQSMVSGITVLSAACSLFHQFLLLSLLFPLFSYLGLLCSSFSSFLNGIYNINFSTFLFSIQYKLKSMNLSLSTASTASDKFYVKFLFSWKYFKIFFVISSLIHVLFKHAA